MASKQEDHELSQTLIEIQKADWRFNASEKSRLCQGKLAELPWPFMLRFTNHLLLNETLASAAGQEELKSERDLWRNAI